jgi:hypothetical protein
LHSVAPNFEREVLHVLQNNQHLRDVLSTNCVYSQVNNQHARRFAGISRDLIELPRSCAFSCYIKLSDEKLKYQALWSSERTTRLQSGSRVDASRLHPPENELETIQNLLVAFQRSIFY